VTPWVRDEVLYVSADPSHVEKPFRIDHLAAARLVLYDAHAGWRDPTRRQLADRANLAGVKLDPWIEVEHVETALNLARRGVGDTIASRAVVSGHESPGGLHTASFDPPLYDTLALVRREGVPLSAATREIVTLARSLLPDELH
jgi:DNA-binding transcriptional LysR family regulator